MDASERFAKRAIETISGRPLVAWDVSPRQGAVDFRCLESPTIAVEVKRLAMHDFEQARNRVSRYGGLVASSEVAMCWSVLIELPTDGHPGVAPDVRRLAAELGPILVALEQRGISSTRGAHMDWDEVRGWHGPVVEFLRLAGDAMAMATPASEQLPAGITLVGGWGAACKDDPNVTARVAEEFINGDSKQALNMREKLGRSTDAERHAFILLTDCVAQAWLFDDWGCTRMPTARLKLPEEIDCLWISRGGTSVWWFDESGWHGTEMERQDDTIETASTGSIARG